MSPMTPEAMALSGELAQALGQAIPADADFVLPSRSRGGRVYPMVRTPEGYAVHQGEGCEGEIFNGVLGCWHARENNMTETGLTIQRPSALAERVEFTPHQVQVLKNTICRGASDDELNLFIQACQHTGLDPFLKQIWAIMRNVNVGTRENPKWEKQLSIQVGVDGYRVMRDRTGLFAGMDGPHWSNDGVSWQDFWIGPGDPALARVTVWRKDSERPFIATCRFEAYKQDSPMWKTMGAEQLAKCAENLAYRRAFPTEMGALPAGAVADYEPELEAPYEVDRATGEIIEGQARVLPAHEEGPGPHAAEAASPEVESREAASAPAPSPNKAPSFPSYRGWVKERIEAAGHHADSIEAEAGREYGNKGWGALTAAECQQLAAKFGVNVPLPGQPSLIA